VLRNVPTEATFSRITARPNPATLAPSTASSLEMNPLNSGTPEMDTAPTM
jgi:hypothetical protein